MICKQVHNFQHSFMHIIIYESLLADAVSNMFFLMEGTLAFGYQNKDEIFFSISTALSEYCIFLGNLINYLFVVTWQARSPHLP